MNGFLTDASNASGRSTDFSRELNTHQSGHWSHSARKTLFIRPCILLLAAAEWLCIASLLLLLAAAIVIPHLEGGTKLS
jgi:hypothetical protein